MGSGAGVGVLGVVGVVGLAVGVGAALLAAAPGGVGVFVGMSVGRTLSGVGELIISEDMI
jgi:hypothetical protein